MDDVRAVSFDEHGWSTSPLEPWSVGSCTAILSPERTSAFAFEAWSHQAKRFLECELVGEPTKSYATGFPMIDAATLAVRLLRGSVEGEVAVQTFPIERVPSALEAGRAAATAMGGAGFDVLVNRTRRLWQFRAAPSEHAEDLELRVSAVLASALLGPILARDGRIFGVKTARERLARPRGT